MSNASGDCTIDSMECPCCKKHTFEGIPYCIECDTPWDDDHAGFCVASYRFCDGDKGSCECPTQISSDGEVSFVERDGNSKLAQGCLWGLWEYPWV